MTWFPIRKSRYSFISTWTAVIKSSCLRGLNFPCVHRRNLGITFSLLNPFISTFSQFLSITGTHFLFADWLASKFYFRAIELYETVSNLFTLTCYVCEGFKTLFVMFRNPFILTILTCCCFEPPILYYHFQGKFFLILNLYRFISASSRISRVQLVIKFNAHSFNNLLEILDVLFSSRTA